MSWSKWAGAEPIDADTYLARVQEEDAYHATRQEDTHLLYVLPDRWDHAMNAANRFARRTGTRYEVRWHPPRRVWIVRQARPLPPGGADA